VKDRRLLALLAALNVVIWGRLALAETSAPNGQGTLDSLGNLQTEARAACEAKGHTLRALVIAYDEQAQPVAARAACGDPKRTKA
jgi:hypothetical protein